MININEEELQCKICYEFLYETVICDKCSNAFCQECAINYKKKAKKYGRIDKCPICGSKNFTFQRCEEIDKLIKKRKHKPLQCQHCKRIIFDKDKYQEHILQCKYQCKFCLKTFDKEDDLLRHIKKNTEELFKALDLMNSSRNKIIYNNEEKPKKKKLIKKKTKEIIGDNEIKEIKSKEKEKNVDETKRSTKKFEIKNKDGKKEEDTKEEEKIIISKKLENNPEFVKKIVKKKVIKKKKIIKKKDLNTINYFDNDINEENLIKKKMNKTNIDVEDKLTKDLNKLNISAEMNSKEKNIADVKFTKLNSNNIKNRNRNKINKPTKINDEANIAEKKTININNEKKEINQEINKKTENKEEELQINNNEPDLIYLNIEQKIDNSQMIEEEEKISRYADYLNNPNPVSIKPSTIPGEAKLNTEYDLYFCGKPNHIDCICCTDHKCKPGNCMCITCMKLNKKYHKLKSHYLINKSGRACKYSHGYFHCYCNYTHIVHDIGNNIFKPVYKCQGENICKPCEEITLLMETYLPSTICQKLRDRETKQAQF